MFASDPLSSVAYATEESMLVLALAGAGTFVALTPISIAIATLLIVVVISYRQTIRAYPSGGGAFIVSRENLGLIPGTVAASALLTDYTLTVAVSVTAGVAAITSAFPHLLAYRVSMSIGFVIIVTLLNLRGAKESSTLFAIPTYAFVATVFTMITVGIAECLDGVCPEAISAEVEIEPVATISFLLLLRAFASGSTALTGVEAVADGVQAFRPPKGKNAAATLGAMGLISITMFLGISTLARLFHVRISEEIVNDYGTVISQIGRAAFNGGVGFWILQVVTAGILLLAANTAYADFPRLSAILARHKLMPRQFRNLGDRLVFSNGIVALATVAILLIWIFDAQVSRLIQLYVVGVFMSFTLSQAGMVRRWLTQRETGWRRGAVVQGIGATVTGVVLIVIASVKFTHGAWIVIATIPILVVTMLAIRRHYLNVAGRLRVTAEPEPPKANRVIVLASHTGRATERAIEYARMIQPQHITVLHVRESRDEDLIDTWDRLYPDQPLTLIEDSGGKPFRTLRDFVANEARLNPQAFITVVIPELVRRRRLGSLVTHPHGLVLKLLLLFVPGVVVTDLTYQRPRTWRQNTLIDPEHVTGQLVAVLTADMTIPVRRAMVYANMLHADTLIAAHLNTDEEQRDRLLRSWDPELGPLHILESPYRGITRPLLRYVRRLRRDAGESTLIHIVIPEFVVPGFWSQILHNQTAFAIKATLIFEPRVAVSSVPWHLAAAEIREMAEETQA